MSAQDPHPVADAALGGAAIVVLSYLVVAASAPEQPTVRLEQSPAQHRAMAFDRRGAPDGARHGDRLRD